MTPDTRPMWLAQFDDADDPPRRGPLTPTTGELVVLAMFLGALLTVAGMALGSAMFQVALPVLAGGGL